MIPTVEQLAKRISTDLYGSRLRGMSSPENPVISDTICSAYKTKYGWDIESREVREATKHLVEQKVPIGSTLNGYYYVLNSREWEPTKAMLMPKFLSIKSKIDLINEMEQEMAAQEAGQMEIPVLKLLNKQLELERQ